MMSKQKIDFQVLLNLNLQIIDPNGISLFSKNQHVETIFSLNLTMPGDYKFIFINVGVAVPLTFSIQIENRKRSSITMQDDIDPLEVKVLDVRKTILVLLIIT